jgi:Zn-dependent peptidase ImmA (M78 family)
MRPARVELAARTAEQMLERLELKHPTEMKIEAIAYELGAHVREVPLRGAEARILVRPKRKAIIHVRAEYEPRMRFDIGHELGHYHLDERIDKSKADVFHDAHIGPRMKQPQEREANVFASALLMPRKLLQPRVRVPELTLMLINRLAAEFQVSAQAAGIRTAELTTARCCLVYAKGNRVAWASKSATWKARNGDKPYGPFNGQRVPQATIMHRCLNGSHAPEIAEDIAASTWIKGPHVTSRSRMIEHCQKVPADDAVLSASRPRASSTSSRTCATGKRNAITWSRSRGIGSSGCCPSWSRRRAPMSTRDVK